ncbi:KipI family sensor histidine kinase inhibitor [Paraburkholderia sp. BL18I3N2]|nr:KipI family sensor histidine kinase inhibitor [Paraburkholderia sp. BL18I3N2]
MAGSCTPGSLKLSYMGSSAILCESTEPLSLSQQTLFWALAMSVSKWPSVEEVIPGMNNLLVILERRVDEPWEVAEQIRAEWPRTMPLSVTGKVVDVPVAYGGEYGPDLKYVAGRAGKSLTDTAALHASGEYKVFFLGAHAGFGYLGGLDQQLHSPRLAKPRLSAPSGTVAIGGMQTGVIAQTSPSGWRLIGKTDLNFFQADRQPPALLAPGDTVRFQIERVET